MTSISADILNNDYDIPPDKIKMIPHGTHLLPFIDKISLKAKYGFNDKKFFQHLVYWVLGKILKPL